MSHDSRERWGSRLGLILAMAGSAVGLGAFLRFPRQVLEHGGGTFMIPYFVALVLAGIPLMWIEWGIGRRGGLAGHGSLPGMLESLWRHPAAKYLGVLGLFMPVVVLVYYCYIESWTLAWTFFSVTGATRGLNQDAMRDFLASYQNLTDLGGVHAAWVPFAFFFATLALNMWVVSRGLRAGIERLAKVGMPILFLFAAILVLRVLTLPARPEMANGVATGRMVGPLTGLAFMYTPDWAGLGRPGVWLAAAGQIFFTLSIGMGTLQAYASYLRKTDDIVRSGLVTAGTIETVEVVLGGSLAIPAVVTFFGVAGAMSFAQAGGFDLAFVAMPMVFNGLPGGDAMATIAGFMWFGLLFLAGITSSVAMATPAVSFVEERFGWDRRQSALALGVVAGLLGMLHILFYTRGFLDEWDYWAGTFGLVVLALVETIVFMWIMGPERAWHEIHEGAAIRIPRIFRFVMTYVTPVFLLVMVGWWLVRDGWPAFLMVDRPAEEVPVRWLSRGVMLLILVVQLLLIRAAWRRRPVRLRA